ncbi:MAG: phosphatidylserine decarboxylase family protein [Verrucomicrobia bacterium]|nr:phosphatidylserine decarboxylase family protein [Verrucomicrobiota bacterium]
MRFSIAKEGLPLAIPFGAAAVVFFILGWTWVAGVCLVLSLAVLSFFRDPARTPPGDPSLVLAPADGLVVGVTQVNEPEYVGGPATRISIFMRLWDVHMTYAPMDGTVEHIAHRPGRFGNAGFAKASERNEANSIGVRAAGERLMFRQVAGMIARRIVCRVKPGDEVRRGERVGLIKFGSRVDVFLPPGYEVLVEKGRRVHAISSPIARGHAGPLENQ